MAVTLTSRSVGMLVAVALGAGWLSSTLTQDAAPAPAARTNVRRPAAAPVPPAERLRDRLATSVAPNRGRNPFVYGSRVAPPVTRDHQRHGDENLVPAEQAIPDTPPPVFRLSGVASNTVDGVNELTAIVIDNGTMVFVKAGDKLSRGHSVVRVDEMSVTLIDETGVTQTIRLP